MSEAIGAGWDYQEELLALLAELVDHGNRLLFAANSKQGTPLPEPVRVHRPYALVERRRATRDDLRRLFAGAIVNPTESETEGD